MTINNIHTKTPKEVAEFCDENYFNFPILEAIETPEDLIEASKQMGTLMGHSAFLASLLSHLKYHIRNAKNNRDKELAADLIDKKSIIEYAYNIISQHYTCLSRRITIHKDVMTELGMVDYGRK